MAGGWWLMPLFGLVFMVVFLYMLGRIFGRGNCGNYRPPENQDIPELKEEISKLRAELAALSETKKSEENEND
jgi:uncharacterized membrane protein